MAHSFAHSLNWLLQIIVMVVAADLKQHSVSTLLGVAAPMSVRRSTRAWVSSAVSLPESLACCLIFLVVGSLSRLLVTSCCVVMTEEEGIVSVVLTEVCQCPLSARR